MLSLFFFVFHVESFQSQLGVCLGKLEIAFGVGARAVTDLWLMQLENIRKVLRKKLPFKSLVYQMALTLKKEHRSILVESI